MQRNAAKRGCSLCVGRSSCANQIAKQQHQRVRGANAAENEVDRPQRGDDGRVDVAVAAFQVQKVAATLQTTQTTSCAVCNIINIRKRTVQPFSHTQPFAVQLPRPEHRPTPESTQAISQRLRNGLSGETKTQRRPRFALRTKESESALSGEYAQS